MRVKCINSKNYALSVGTEYVVVDELENRFQVKNDKGLIRNYAKSLFEVVNGTESTAPTAAAPQEAEQQPDSFTISLVGTSLSLKNNNTIVDQITLNPNISDFGELQVCDSLASDCDAGAALIANNIQDEEVTDALLDAVSDAILNYYLNAELSGSIVAISIPSNTIESELTNKLLAGTNTNYSMLEQNGTKVFTLTS